MVGLKLQMRQLYESRTQRTLRLATLSSRNEHNPQKLICRTKKGPKDKTWKSKLLKIKINTLKLAQARNGADNPNLQASP